MTEYDKYYSKLLETWRPDHETGGLKGWAASYYGIVSSVINENEYKNCAEVGIGYGFHARQILDNTEIENICLIDPMIFYPNDMFCVDVKRFGGFEKLVKNIKVHLRKHTDRYRWYRVPSLSITNEQIPDGSLDLVFIDGDHSYEAVSKDLEFWWKKIRIGGMMLGDDYQSCHLGTTRAVDEFSERKEIPLTLLTKENQTYPIYCFEKRI